MSLLASYLREQTAGDVRRLEPSERIRFALRLGDDDLQLYAAATGIPPDEARGPLRATRQLGRRSSASAAMGA